MNFPEYWFHIVLFRQLVNSM